MEAAVERVGGLQTQVSRSGYIGLWSRLAGLTRGDYTAALHQRRLIQGWLMRVTIHTVSAADYWPMAVAVRRARRAWWLRAWGTGTTDADMRALADSIREHLAAGPLPQRELQRLLAARGVERSVANAAGLWVDLVRVPPPGTWDRPRADRYGLAEDWLPPTEVTEADAQDLLLRRYLGGYGPATMADVSSWTGIAVGDLAAVVERADLRRFRDEAGRALLDLPDAPLPDPAIPAPVRFIASFDPILMAHARRAEVVPEQMRAMLTTNYPQSWNSLLVDGQMAGTWTHSDARVELRPLRPLSADERRAIDEEAHRLEGFLAG